MSNSGQILNQNDYIGGRLLAAKLDEVGKLRDASTSSEDSNM